MTNFSPYANFGYLSLIKEATEGTPVKPTNFLRILKESLMPKFNIVSVQTVAGDRERNVRSVPGKVEIEGDVEFYVEPKMIGHFLRALLGAPTTQTLVSSVSYRHVFEVSDSPKSYTIDIQPADAPWVHRFYGCQISDLKFSISDNLIKCVAKVTPRKAFINARVTTAASSGTALEVDQTAGLTTSDTILVIDGDDGYTTLAEFTISSITDDNNLVVSTIGASLAVGDLVVIKRATSSYDQNLELTYFGGSQVSTGDDIDNTSAEDIEDYEIELMNETEARHFAGLQESARYPGAVLTKGFSAKAKISKFYNSDSKLDRARKNEKMALRVFHQGETALGANSAVKARSYWGSGNGFYVECATAGKAGNDVNVTIVLNDTDDLAASISGNNILIELANATASKNTGTLIASAVNALTGIDAAAEGTGAEQFTAAVPNENLGFYDGGTNPTVGRDASEKEYLQFDFADTRIEAYFPNADEDAILQEEIPLVVYKDTVSGQQKKNWSVRAFLVNGVSSY